VIAEVCENWGYFVFLTQMPQFFSGKSFFSLVNDSASVFIKFAVYVLRRFRIRYRTDWNIPYLVMAITREGSSHLAEFIQSKWHLQVNANLGLQSLHQTWNSQNKEANVEYLITFHLDL
jgi:hypothetical protein